MTDKITSFFKSSFFTEGNNIYYLGIIVGILILFFIIISLLVNKKKNRKIKKALLIAENEKTEAENAKKKLEESTELIRSQAALANILRNVTGTERSLEQFLQDALEKLLSLPWLSVLSKGSIFLKNNEGNLDMIAEKGLGEVAERCKLIKPGECLCGLALSEKKMQYCNHINSEHTITFKNMQEHGHYNLPVIMNDEVLGVLNIYTEHNHNKTDFEVKFLETVCDTLASVINRKKTQAEILKAKNELALQMKELEEKNKAIRKYSVQLEQQRSERESLNQMILAQKKKVEEKNKQSEEYAKQLENQSKEQEKLNQQLFAQKLEVEQRNVEAKLYAEKLEKQAKEQEALNQKLFAQSLEVEQRNSETQQYAKELEEKAKEQEALNQKLFAQKLEVEQRNSEIQQYAEKIEKSNKEQEALNQKLFAQKLEVEQRNSEAKQYAEQLEKQTKEQEALNQKLFAQKLEVEQRNIEVEQYLKQIEEQKKEQDKLNQKLFAQTLEVDQRRIEIERYSKEVEILKEKSESSLKQLSDSINYSKYIQDSLFPTDETMNELIRGEFFIYYKPKETIGGDFYYANKINDYLILGVADCTGHGVPGALITMLGITFLDDIIDRNTAENTGEGLMELRERIKRTFKSYGKSIKNKNGLDIALCAINLKTNVMQFSGAFSPMFIFRNEELIEYKATRNPIGYYPVEKEFETKEIKLQKDDVIYLFSDGYPDQLGGEHERKFSKRQFKELLFEIHKYPMSKQKIFVEKIMQKWMGNQPQVDDITLMGIKWENDIENSDFIEIG
ncbi:MAG: SpoIIE family protein phosphatase [Bacteroidales bacterium]|nr:SpoIIE family protein phosphatase [Bacteroidales bacterium]